MTGGTGGTGPRGPVPALRGPRAPVTADAPVLVLRALGLGDALAVVPALRGLRRAFPGRPLLLAAAGPPARLLAAHGLVDGVVPTPDLSAPDGPPGRGLGEHLAVNLHGRGPQSHRLLLAGLPAAVIAFDSAQAGVRGPAWDESEHEVSRWCRLVRWAGGPCDPAELRLGTGRGHGGPVVVHPGASTGTRRWPARRFAALARALLAAGHPVVVTGTADETRHCAEVCSGAGLDAAADLSGHLDLDELAEVVAAARLVVCGDTGVGHLATAFGTPSVLLFGPVPPSRWGPAVEPWRHRVIWHGPARPRPPHARHSLRAPDDSRADPVLLRIGVEEALEACLGQLRLGAATGPDPEAAGAVTSGGHVPGGHVPGGHIPGRARRRSR